MDFDLETIEDLILSSKVPLITLQYFSQKLFQLPGAKALISEKKGDLDGAAKTYLLQFEAALSSDESTQEQFTLVDF